MPWKNLLVRKRRDGERHLTRTEEQRERDKTRWRTCRAKKRESQHIANLSSRAQKRKRAGQRIANMTEDQREAQRSRRLVANVTDEQRLAKRNHNRKMYKKNKERKKRLKLLGLVVRPKPENIWKKDGVSWDTRPPQQRGAGSDLIVTLNKYNWFPSQAKLLRLYDPFYNTGAVVESYKEIGWCNERIDHRKEDCFAFFQKRVTRKTIIVTNPPFLEDVLLTFCAFLVIMDCPFVLILRRGVSETHWFGDFVDLMTAPNPSKSGNFTIRSLNKSFQMLNTMDGKLTGFAGLSIVTYYPKVWNWTPPDHLFERAILKYDLHLPMRNNLKKVRARIPYNEYFNTN